MASVPAPDKRVFLHIGTPKSGTSFIQDTLRSHKGELAQLGFQYPATYPGEMFHATLEIRENYHKFGRSKDEVDGKWRGLCQRAKAFDGTTIISSEFFAACTADQVGRTIAELDGVEVHVVITARDLGRQFPASWQQGTKHGSTWPYRKFQERMLEPDPTDERVQGLWALQDLPDILDRWSSHVPADRIHVVTCPPSGTAPGVLWERFCTAVGLDPSALTPSSGGANTSLGITEIDLLRRVNRVMNKRGDDRLYARMVNRHFVAKTLRSYTSDRPETPPELLKLLRAMSEQWVEKIAQGGYQVVGDLDELVPSAPDRADFTDPDEVPLQATVRLAANTIVDLLTEIDQLQTELEAAKEAAKTSVAQQSLAKRAAGKAKRIVKR